jgi:hypothetical protein
LKFLIPNARNDVCALSPDPARNPVDHHPLWLLNKMSNRDKHREIPLALFAAGDVAIAIRESDGSDYFRSLGSERLELGADAVPLVEYSRSPGVTTEIRATLQIVFDQGVETADREVAPTLRWFHKHITDTVFQRLEPHL